MGFLLWGALTAFALAAGIAVAIRAGSRLSIGEQLVAAMLVAITFVVASAQALGYTSVLYPWTLGGSVALESLIALVLARPSRADWSEFTRRVLSAGRRSLSPGSLAILVPALVLVLYLVAYVWLLPSWSWDALWYHDPITAYAFQDHSLRWHDTPIPWVNSYPKNIELLALWNVIFSPDDRFIDGVQLPMSLMGVIALATMCRRVGAPQWMAFGLASCWLLIPAVFLNIPSNYIDASCASLLLAAVLFLARMDATPVHRVFGTLALGLYAGAKVTGAEHAVLLALLVAFVLWRQKAPRAFLQGAAMAVTLVLLGGATYLRDWILFRNPVWPVKVKLLGHELPGTYDLKPLSTPPWGGPDNLQTLWRSFFEKNPPYMVDVRVGGFGPLWPYVLMPLVAIALLIAIARRRKGRSTCGMLVIPVLLIAALLTPAAWWCRYTLGIPAAGFIGAAFVLPQLPRRWMPELALAGIAVIAALQAWPARLGFYAGLDRLQQSWQLSPRERDAVPIGIWQQEWMPRREELVQPGDATIYDDSVEMLYPLWRFDWRNRVLYRPWNGSATTWLKQLEADGARWAAVREHSPSEEALRDAGWTFLGRCHREACAVWALPRSPFTAPAASAR